MAGRLSSLRNLTTTTTTATVTLPEELDVRHIDVVAVAGLTGLGLIGPAGQPTLHIDLLPLSQVLVAGVG